MGAVNLVIPVRMLMVPAVQARRAPWKKLAAVQGGVGFREYLCGVTATLNGQVIGNK